MNLKSNGEKIEVLSRLNEWLNDNIQLFLENGKIYKFEEIDRIQSDLYSRAEEIMVGRRKKINERYFRSLKNMIVSKENTYEMKN
tara:strand:+ start:1396 stop:1650 length:255 start_codon:yes stop_codon:yes gene_type:complete